MDEKLNVKAIFVKVLSKWYYFLIACLIFLPIAYGYVYLTPAKYQIKASMLLSDEEGSVGPQSFMKGMELLTSSTGLDDEMGLLQSFANVQRTVSLLNFGVSYYVEENWKERELYGKKPFTITVDSSIHQAIGVPIYIERISSTRCMVRATGEDVHIYDVVANKVKGMIPVLQIEQVWDFTKPFESKYLGFKINFSDSVKMGKGDYSFRIDNIDAVAGGYQGRLQIKPITLESNIVEVTIREEVPQKGIEFLNRLLQVYLENELYKKNQLGLKTIQFIDDQLSGVSDSLKQVEGSLESFRARNNVMDIQTKAENLMTNLDRLEQEKADIEVKLEYYRYISNSLDNDDVSDMVAPSTFGVEDPLLSNLLIEFSKLNQERSGLNYSARQGNPLAEVVELKIANNKKLIKENVSNIIDASTIALNDLNRRIAQINFNLEKLPRNERELVKIQRRFDFSDNVYNYLLQKRAEAGVAIASNVVDKTIVDDAREIGVVWPNTKLIYAFALIVAFGSALAVIVLKDSFNDTIVTHEDLEKNTKIPFLGVINHGSRREKDNIVANTMSPVGESFRTLRVNLQYLALGRDIRVVGFTSSRESEGKTFCAVNLAASIAQSRKRTVLIDADMRRPRVDSYFQLENEKGLSSFLIGECSVGEIINETGIKGFDVITSGPIPPNPLDLIAQSRMEELINELKKTYNTVIIDAPPIGYVSEYIILMKYTEANIYVVRSEYTTRFNLGRINQLYNENKINNFSVLLNDVKYSRLNGYSYSYKYTQKKRKKFKVG